MADEDLRHTSIVGELGFVTIGIRAGHPGEIVVRVRGGSEAFVAWADEPVPRGSQVVVVDELSGRGVRVTNFSPGGSSTGSSAPGSSGSSSDPP